MKKVDGSRDEKCVLSETVRVEGVANRVLVFGYISFVVAMARCLGILPLVPLGWDHVSIGAKLLTAGYLVNEKRGEQ